MIKPLSDLTSFTYQNLVKKILFLIDAETVHHTFLNLGSLMGTNFVTRGLVASIYKYDHKNLEQTLNGIKFTNPVGLSAGFDYNGDLTGILPDLGFGWHTIGTVTFEAYGGNKKPRLGRFPDSKALLVNKGLKGIGTRAIIKKLSGKKFRIPTGISIASTNKHFDSIEDQLKDIAQSFTLFEQSNLDHSYYEMNISCPNTFGGEPFFDPKRLNALLTVLDNLKILKPVYIKMPIDQSESETLAMFKVIKQHNIQGLILGNLTKDHNNPAVTKADRAKWAKMQGNLSGKPTWERSNKLVKLAKAELPGYTIIGTGGIFSKEDAAHKMELGADLVQLISGMVFNGPQLIGQINQYLALRTKTSSQAPIK